MSETDQPPRRVVPFTDEKPLSEIFAEGRREVRETERRIADARVAAVEARLQVSESRADAKLARMEAAFFSLRRDLEAAIDRALLVIQQTLANDR